MRVARVVVQRTVTYHLAEMVEVTVLSSRGLGARRIETDAIRVVEHGRGESDVRAGDSEGAGGHGAWLALTETSERQILAELGASGVEDS